MNNYISCLFFVCLLLSCNSQKRIVTKSVKKDWYTYAEDFNAGTFVQIRDTTSLYNDTANIDWTKDVFYWEHLGGKKYRFIIYNNSFQGFTQPYIFNPHKWEVIFENNTMYLLMVGDGRTDIYQINYDLANKYMELYRVKSHP